MFRLCKIISAVIQHLETTSFCPFFFGPLHSLKLTVRPWKWTLPKGNSSSKPSFFRVKKCCSFQGGSSTDFTLLPRFLPPSFCSTHPRILAASASNSLRRLSCSKRRRSTAPSVTVSGPNQRFKSLGKYGRKIDLAAHVDRVIGWTNNFKWEMVTGNPTTSYA